ncbi:hypothetical protein Tco_0097377 [Tanacetum coccineum]
MFDEYFKPPPSVVSSTISASTLPIPDTTGASSSTAIDQYVPSPSTSPNNETTESPIQSTNVEQPLNEEDGRIDMLIPIQIHSPLYKPSSADYHTSIRCAPFEALHGRKCRSPVLWARIGEGSLIGPELTDNWRKPLEFEVGDRVMLKVPPWKGVVRFGKKGKLAPRYVGPFEILERISHVAYRLRLPKELSGVHDTFHVSSLKKCLADASLHVPLNEIKVDKTLRFIEEPVEILDREIKSLKRNKISLVKVRWDSKSGPEFT